MREDIKADEFVVDGRVDRDKLYPKITPLSEIPTDSFFWAYIRKDAPHMQRTYTRIAEITEDMKRTGPQARHIEELKEIAIVSHLNMNDRSVTGAGRITVQPLGVELWEERDGKSTKISEVRFKQERTSPRDTNPETSSFGNKLLKDMVLGLMLKAVVDPKIDPKLSEKIFEEFKELGRGGSGNEVEEMMHSPFVEARRIPGLHKNVLKNAIDVLAAIGKTRGLSGLANDQYQPTYVRAAATSRLITLASDPNNHNQDSALYGLGHIGTVNPCDDLSRRQSSTTRTLGAMAREAINRIERSGIAQAGRIHREGVYRRRERERAAA